MTTKRVRIDIADYRSIVFLTGAGISAASGIQTYRGPDGLWNDTELYQLSHASTLRSRPQHVWRFFSGMRALASTIQPNRGHEFLAELEAGLRPDQTMTIITQNIDGLHSKAGSRNVIEFHGSALRSRCSNAACSRPAFADHQSYEAELPMCSQCGSLLRPDVVLFGEPIPAATSTAALKALARCTLFVAVGTSGTVYPAAQFVQGVYLNGGRTVFLNLAPLESGGHFFSEQHLGPSEVTLPALFGDGLEPVELEEGV